MFLVEAAKLVSGPPEVVVQFDTNQELKKYSKTSDK